MGKEKAVTIVTKEDLSLVENNSLNEQQLGHLLKHTPEKYKRKRPAKGGGQWTYVTGGYVKKCLNLMFGWNWDFEIVDEQIMIEAKEVIVKGKLTCRSNGETIVKMQYGNKEIMLKKNTNIPLSIGNDMKAAATDCLKKCAAEIGIAADVYNPEEFREIAVQGKITLDQVRDLYDEKADLVNHEDQLYIDRIIEEKELSFSRIPESIEE